MVDVHSDRIAVGLQSWLSVGLQFFGQLCSRHDLCQTGNFGFANNIGVPPIEPIEILIFRLVHGFDRLVVRINIDGRQFLLLTRVDSIAEIADSVITKPVLR